MLTQPIVRRLGFALATLIIALLIPTLITAQGIPPIPHQVEGRGDCLGCHEQGKLGAPQIPENHAGRTNDLCQQCHQPASQVAPAAEPPPSETTLTPVGPLPAAHPDICLACHRPTSGAEATPPAPVAGPPAIPHSLVDRENCLECHEEGIGGAPQIPADHAGRTNDICQDCHQPSQAPPSPTPAAVVEAIPTPIVAYPRAEEVNTCLDCHSTLENQPPDIVQWQRSIHAERNVACVDCHGGDSTASTKEEAHSPEAGYVGASAKANIPDLCASCHADVVRMRQYDLPTDQWAKYKESIHGLRLAEGDPNVATCYDCHGGHLILKANDPASSVYPSNVPNMCASCHANKELMAPYDIPTNQFDLYRQSVHGHALLDNQDFRAPNCATCHGTHGAAPPGFAEVANVCGSCHGATQDYYLKSPHANAGDGAPKCVTCHGRYDVSEPSEALYVGAEPRHCGACHTIDSAGGQVAQSLYDTIRAAAQSYEEAEAAIQVARQVGMLVAPMEGQLRQANTDLITARAAQHTLNIDTVRERADDAQAVAEQVKESAQAAVAASVFRRRAMIIAIAVIGLTIAALYMLKRELDRRLEDET